MSMYVAIVFSDAPTRDEARHRKNGAKGGRVRRRCRGCDMVTTPAGIASHQKCTGHVGWDALAQGGAQ